MDVAAFDLGSNSFHMLVARVQRNGSLAKLGSRKEMLRLGDVVAAHGVLTEEALERSLRALRAMLDVARELGAERIAAVGTSALREASNGDELVRIAAERLGLAIEILSGDEEGKLVYGGARSRLSGLPDRALVIDLGGGSVELAVGDGDTCLGVESLPLGFLRVRRALGVTHESDPATAVKVRQHVKANAAAAVRRLGAFGPRAWVLSGGTARALGRIALSLGVAELTGPGLRRLAAHLAERDHEHLLALGLDPARALGFGVGVTVIEALVELIGAPTVRVSHGGLREGIVLREMMREAKPTTARPAGISDLERGLAS